MNPSTQNARTTLSAKDRIVVALDVPDRASALTLVEQLSGLVGMFKIGNQLFTAEGPDLVREIIAAGERVFLDLKFHDIPNTVAGAIQSAVSTGAWMVNVHCSGGSAMMKAAAEAATKAAQQASKPRPLVIGVTVLTSMTEAALKEININTPMLDQVTHLAKLAKSSGLDGVVASPHEVRAIRQACGTDFEIVTPGIRPVDNRADDQKRTVDVAQAFANGADYIVVGRPIREAADPRAAAQAIQATIAALFSE